MTNIYILKHVEKNLTTSKFQPEKERPSHNPLRAELSITLHIQKHAYRDFAWRARPILFMAVSRPRFLVTSLHVCAIEACE